MNLSLANGAVLGKEEGAGARKEAHGSKITREMKETSRLVLPIVGAVSVRDT